MADREKIMEELRQEIEALEKEMEEKKLSTKPVMVPVSGRGVPQEYIPGIKELEREIERKRNLLETFESGLFGQHEHVPKFDKNALLLPEYREGGYFTSQDFYDKCEEFHRSLEAQGIDYRSLRRDELIFRKKKFLFDKYGITWLSEEHQFLPGTVIDVHISHPNN